ncbi:hypothetical protein [Marinivivus vitaminiproducens]|uniref:hypothetical protein n=1 Tax=Marinivivus vitaminiproducens TaxID=3035935 RepID=UPI00279C52F5|nr:hypothetical protein P4R82_10110 [Geminicoccaceae bacterium SCSIO 64248]
MQGEIVVDAPTLAAYGHLTVPGAVWRALQRYGSWVEPVLVTEWARLMRGYGELSMPREFSPEVPK